MSKTLQIAMNWYRYPNNDRVWDQFIQDFASALEPLGIITSDQAYRGDTHELIQSGEFALAQCCGIDVYKFRDLVEPIAAPIFTHTETPGRYQSVIVTTEHGGGSDPSTGLSWRDFAESVHNNEYEIIINQPHSWSGSLVARLFVERLTQQPGLLKARWPDMQTSGGHFAGTKAIAEGDAGRYAFIDENSWHLMQPSLQAAGLADKLRVVGRSTQMPVCPFVVPKGRPEIAKAVRSVLATLNSEGAKALGIRGFFHATESYWLQPFASAANELGLDY